MAKKFWLMKTEPEVFGIEDLKKRPKQTEYWDGVRNYRSRNEMRDNMSVGDQVLFYHSSSDVIGVAGVAEISGPAVPDPTALDPKSKYHDPKAKPGANPWVMIPVKFKAAFKKVVTLATLKETPGLEGMLVTKRGIRWSIQPVTAEEFRIVVELAKT
jgi:predicted RNA-binding protein with PUA-like domain